MKKSFIKPMGRPLPVPDGSADIGFVCPIKLKIIAKAVDENGEPIVDLLDKTKNGMVFACKKAGKPVEINRGGARVEFACKYCKGLISVEY